MIALDTSALLRHLLDDHHRMARRVGRLIDGPEAVGISVPVLIESLHVLRGQPYLRPNPDVADALIELLGHENVILVDLEADLASASIAAVRHLSPRHIADALIGATARQAGARQLVTADRTFASRLVPVVQLDDLSA